MVDINGQGNKNDSIYRDDINIGDKINRADNNLSSLKILIITNKIFSPEENTEEEILKLRADAEVKIKHYKKVNDDDIEEAEIIFGWPRYKDLKKALNLKWLQLPSSGVESYTDISLYADSDIILTNSSGVYGKVIAEHITSLILAFNRNLPHYINKKAENEWEKIHEVRDLFGSKIGILGFGDIGRKTAELLAGFGTEIMVVKRTYSEKPEYIDKLFTAEDMDKVIEESDYLILALPNTEETKGLISKDKLELMKENCFLINVGRGELIKEEALINALKNGEIAGAGLDVTADEPLEADSELWDLDNVILTQHTAGFSPSNYKRQFSIFLDNLNKYLSDSELKNEVDFNLGY